MARRTPGNQVPDFGVKTNKRTHYADGVVRYTGMYQDRDGHWISAGTDVSRNKAIANAQMAGVEYYSTGVALAHSSKTIDQFWDTVYPSHLESLGKSTQDTYPILYTYWIKPFLGRMIIGEVDLADVKGWLNKIRKTEGPSGKVPAASTVYKINTVLSSILSYAVENNARQANPCLSRSYKKALGKPDEPEVKAMEKAEFEAFLEAVPEFWRPLVLAAVGTGCRPNEVVGLRPCDIDWETGIVDINHGDVLVNKERHGERVMTTLTPKDKEDRDVPMTPTLLAVLDAHRESRGLSKTSEQRLFVGPQGGFVDRVTFNARVIKPAMIKAKIADKGYTFKTLRSTYATWLLDSGVDATTVMELMGHSSNQVLKRYTKTLSTRNEKVLAAWKKIDGEPHLKIVPEAEAS